MKAGSARRSSALASLSLALSLEATSGAAEFATSLPHTLWLGAPAGLASSREVDARGTRRAASLPEPESVRVGWHQRLAGGASGNVLVDAAGRIFVPGLRRVTELASEGSIRHELEAPFSTSVAAALLADGTRAVLTREGRVLGWAETGACVFQAELSVPPPTGSSALLPLDDGGLLVAVGRWLFAFDASRGPPLHVGLPSAVALVRQVGERTLIVDERGRVFEWRRGSVPQPIGELSAPADAALGDGGLLIALTRARTLESLDPSTGRRQELARFDAPGLLPLIALPEAGTWVTLGPEGDWMLVGANMPPAARARPKREGGAVREAQLLVDARGGIVHWAANRPLSVGNVQGAERDLGEVRCSDPVGLVPAGPGRLVAVCGSGALWLLESPALP